MFNTIIDNWHIWQANGAILISNEETKKLYSAPGIDTAVNFMYFEAGIAEARKLWTDWKAQSKQ